MAMGENPNVAFHNVRGITWLEFDTGIAILLVEQNARKAVSIWAKDYAIENGMINICGTLFGKQIDRLRKMNEPAYQFFLGKRVDLVKEPLEIALCAQHNNGGLAVDDWWRTNIQGFYACGEVAGTHGVCRPGGSALNAGQVGSLRAALDIAKTQRQDDAELPTTLIKEVGNTVNDAEGFICETENCRDLWEAMSSEFFDVAGPIRDLGKISRFLTKVIGLLAEFDKKVRVSSFNNLFYLYHFKDALLGQKIYCQAMLDYFARGGRSRGSALYVDPQGKTQLDKIWLGLRFDLDSGELDDQIQEIAIKDNQMLVEWRQRHPLVIKETAFETAWKAFRKEYGLE